MLALDTGQVWWSHEAVQLPRHERSMTDTLYISTADGEIVALRTRTGAELWRQNALLHRGLSAPARMDDGAVVVADFEGYVHWLDKASGTLIARVRGGKTRVSTAPVVVGNLVLVINDRGQLSVYRVTRWQHRARRSSATASSTDSATAPEG